MTPEDTKAALIEELGGRIKLALVAKAPDVLAPKLLDELAETAAEEALHFFYVAAAIDDNPEAFSSSAADKLCTLLRGLFPWK